MNPPTQLTPLLLGLLLVAALLVHAAQHRHVPAGAAGDPERASRQRGRHPAHAVGLHAGVRLRPDLLRSGRRPLRPPPGDPDGPRGPTSWPASAAPLPPAAGQLVVLRLLQGLAACGGVVLARTMVRDLAEKDQAARAMSLMNACTSIAPMLAPLIGGQVLWFLGWRAIFWVLAGIGVVAWTGRLSAPARDPAARIPPALPSRLGAAPLRRAGAPSRLHGLRADRRLPVRRAVFLPVGLAVRVHRALRRGAAHSTA